MSDEVTYKYKVPRLAADRFLKELSKIGEEISKEKEKLLDELPDKAGFVAALDIESILVECAGMDDRIAGELSEEIVQILDRYVTARIEKMSK